MGRVRYRQIEHGLRSHSFHGIDIKEAHMYAIRYGHINISMKNESFTHFVYVKGWENIHYMRNWYKEIPL